MKEIIVTVISWNFNNLELFSAYGLDQNKLIPKTVSYDYPAEITDLPPAAYDKVDIIHLPEDEDIYSPEKEILNEIINTAESIYLIVHKATMKSWKGKRSLNKMIEGKLVCPPVPTHSNHGPFIDPMFTLAQQFKDQNSVQYKETMDRLRMSLRSNPKCTGKNGYLIAAAEMMNRTLRPTGPRQILSIADGYENLLIRDLVNKEGVRETLEEMEMKNGPLESMIPLRTKLHRLLFPADD